MDDGTTIKFIVSFPIIHLLLASRGTRRDVRSVWLSIGGYIVPLNQYCQYQPPRLTSISSPITIIG